MATHGRFVIFRMSDTADTEDSITTDKVEFDGDAQVPDGRSGLVSFNPILSRTTTENPAPFEQFARKPDTGFAGTRYTCQVFFDESDGSSAEAIEKIAEWMRQDNAIKGKFKNGRFGVRNDYRPEFDLLPDNTKGYKFVSFDINQELLHHTLVRGTIVLELSGVP